METKTTVNLIDFLDNIDILENYNLSYLQMVEIFNQCINKYKFEDETMLKCVSFNVDRAIFDIMEKAFKIGYLHGYKHHKDNGNKTMIDNTFNEPKIIDINNQLRKFIKYNLYPNY